MSSVSAHGQRRCINGPQCYYVTDLRSDQAQAIPQARKQDRCYKCIENNIGPPGELDDATAAEEHGELFRAARVLFEKGIVGENLIISTLAFAARASVTDMPWLTQLKDLFLDAGEEGGAWESLWRLFVNSFDTLQLDSIEDGVVPIIWRADVRASVFHFDPAKPKAYVVGEIALDVYSRSVKPRDVKARYEKSLRAADIPWERWDRGSISYKAYKGYLRILVRPEDTKGVDFMDQHLLRSGEQLPFPPPAIIESAYEGVWKHFRDDALKGKQKEESFKPKNLIPACVAWYLGGYENLVPGTKLQPEVVRALDQYLLEPLGEEELKSTSSNRARQIREAARNAYPLIDRVDQELRDEQIWRRLSKNLSD